MSFDDPDPTRDRRAQGYDVPGAAPDAPPPTYTPPANPTPPSNPTPPAYPLADPVPSVATDQPSASGEARPVTVTMAGVAVIVNLCVSVLSYGMVVANQEALVSSVESQLSGTPGIEAVDLPTLVRVVLFGGGLCELVISAVFAVLAIGALRRRNGLRIACAVVAWVLLVSRVMWFVSSSGYVVSDQLAAYTNIGSALSGISILLLAVTGVLLFVPATNRWYSAGRDARRGQPVR